MFSYSCRERTHILCTALAVACRDIDVRNVKALIIGPHETPYEFGFFEVSVLIVFFIGRVPCPMLLIIHKQVCDQIQ